MFYLGKLQFVSVHFVLVSAPGSFWLINSETLHNLKINFFSAASRAGSQ